MNSIFQSRLAIVGREFILREIAFDDLGKNPTIGGLPMRAHGPVSEENVRSLAYSASDLVLEMGYHPDSFVIVGLGQIGLIALIPATPPRTKSERLQLMRCLGIAHNETAPAEQQAQQGLF